MAVLPFLVLCIGCAGSDPRASEATGQTRAQADPPTQSQERHILNPTVEFRGKTLYLAMTDLLPPHLKVGFEHPPADPWENPMLFLSYADGRIVDAMPFRGGSGFLADLTGDGRDELVLTELPTPKLAGARPIMLFPSVSYAGQSAGWGATATPANPKTVVYHIADPGLPSVLFSRTGGKLRFWGSADPPRDEAGQVTGPRELRESVTSDLWADLFGTGRPVFCHTANETLTVTMPDGTQRKKQWRELSSYWAPTEASDGLQEKYVGRRLPDDGSLQDVLAGLLKDSAANAH